MKKKIIILSSLIFLFLVSLIVYTKAENSSVKNSKEGINWQIGIASNFFAELSDGYVVLQYESCGDKCSNYFALKYDKNGKMVWKKQIDSYDKITPTKDGGYILWNYYNVKYITKYDKDGNQIWQNNSNESIYDLISVDDGVIALSDKGLTKYSYSDGTVIWDTTNVNELDNISDISGKVIETEDGYIAVGVKSEKVNDKTKKNITSIIKYNKDGKIIWNQQHDNIFSGISKMINTSDGYIVVGRNKTEAGSVASMAKIDKSGAIKWQKNFQKEEDSEYSGLYIDVTETNDGYVAVGYDSDGNKVYNGFIIKYDKSGNVKWQHEEKNSRFNQILVNGDEYIVGGSYNDIGTLFIYDKDGNLTDYHHIATGDRIEFSTDNFNDYIVLTEYFQTSYSINKKQPDMDKSGVYGIYKVGDVVEYNGVKYYTIEDSDSNQEYVTLLKADNLTPDEINKYKGDIQVTENGVPFYTNNKCYWNSPVDHKEDGCTNQYKTSFAQKIIEKWASDALKEEDLAKVGGYKVRSISIDELINNLGYYYGEVNGTSLSTCLAPTLDTPEWVNNIEPYWTMSGYDDGSSVYEVSSNETQTCNEEPYNTYGIRPVINLKKVAIEKYSSNDNNLYCENGYDYEKQTKYNEFNIGDEVEYNGEKYYVIEDSDNYTKYITLLKAEPLTVEEVNKYSGGEYTSKDGEMPYRLGCDSTHPGNCINLYDESLLKKVVDNWSGSFGKDLVKVDGYKVRLITFDEIIDNLEYVEYPSSPSDISYKVTDNWMYNNNYSYWTMSGYEDSTSALYVIRNTGVISKEWSVLGTNFVRPVINLDKCAVDGGCYEEDVAIGCKDDKTVVNVPSTLKMISKILLIISSILIIGGIGIITFNYIKASRERK